MSPPEEFWVNGGKQAVREVRMHEACYKDSHD